MRLFNCGLQESWFKGLPSARIPYGDEDKLREYFERSDLARELDSKDFLFAIQKRLYLEWCLEQESKGLPTGEGRLFDNGVFEKLIADEMQYEFERSTLPNERSNRGTFYEVRNRVLEAFVKNAVLFLKENQGIDGVKGNNRNLRCNLDVYITRPQTQQAA